MNKKLCYLKPVVMAACVLLAATLACNPRATVVVTATPTPEMAVGVTATLSTIPPTSPATTVAPPEGTSPPPVTTEAGCTLDGRWVADVTVPDNTEFTPGTAFVKTWRVRNAGTCPWEAGTQLVFASGDQMGGPASVSVPAVAPGATTDISVNLTAPASPGTYKGNWQLQSPDGIRFGAIIWVKIVVPAPATATPTRTPTPTPTSPPPTGLAILSFSAEVVQDIPPAGKRIRFSWRTVGAASAGIWSGTQMRFPKYWEAAPPGEGSLTVDVATTFYRDPTMTLVAQDTSGNSVQATVVVPWACQYSYFFVTTERTCPAYEASTTWAAEEPFEHGRMIWLQEVRTETTVYPKVILVFYNDGRYEKYADTWTETEPESDPAFVPPTGLYQPIRGFGKLWRTNTSVRDRLGWATAPEQGFTTQWQMRIAESIGIPFYVRRLDGKVIQAGGWDTSSGTWQEIP